jgi:hypothetical protein
VEQEEEDGEGEKVEQRAHRADHHHEALDQADVPAHRPGRVLGIGAVERHGRLRCVVEQVVQEHLQRQHRQEGQEQGRARHAEHVAEVGAGPHQHVLGDVDDGAPALPDGVAQDAQVLVEQDDLGGFLGDVGRGVDREADVGRVQRGRVVDAVAEEAHGVPEPLQGQDQAVLLLRRDAAEQRARR